jgi:hypothetical protein
MLIRAEQNPMSSDQPVEIIFDLGSEHRDVSMRGQIAHVENESESTCIGVEFTNVFSLHHTTIKQYLHHNLHS